MNPYVYFIMYTTLYNMADTLVIRSTRSRQLGQQSRNPLYNEKHNKWPTPRTVNEKVFIIPERLKQGDIIRIQGTLISDHKKLVAELITGRNFPDYKNIACKLEATFPNRSVATTIKRGKEILSEPYTELNTIITGLIFDIKFIVSVSDMSKSLIVGIGDSNIHYIKLRHTLSDIKFLSLSGDIKNISLIEFKYSD